MDSTTPSSIRKKTNACDDLCECSDCQKGYGKCFQCPSLTHSIKNLHRIYVRDRKYDICDTCLEWCLNHPAPVVIDLNTCKCGKWKKWKKSMCTDCMSKRKHELYY